MNTSLVKFAHGIKCLSKSHTAYFYQQYQGETVMSINNLPAGSDVTKAQLISDFKVVISDAEALIKATASQGGEALASLRTKTEESLAVAKEKMADAQEALIEKSKVAAQATDDYVHENPWRAVGVAAGVGLIVGLLIGRR